MMKHYSYTAKSFMYKLKNLLLFWFSWHCIKSITEHIGLKLFIKRPWRSISFVDFIFSFEHTCFSIFYCWILVFSTGGEEFKYQFVWSEWSFLVFQEFPVYTARKKCEISEADATAVLCREDSIVLLASNMIDTKILKWSKDSQVPFCPPFFVFLEKKA